MSPPDEPISRSRAFIRFGDPSSEPVHLPALDGVRGLAVMAVVLFHGNWDWARGGFLGVSLFFTLSGFLITSLLIAEHRSRRYVDLSAFWGRRFRRLLPAAWLTLAAVAIALVSLGEMTTEVRGDIWAALANVANWRFLAAGSSYNDLFASPSPVRHFWSLAIEEQAYLVVPFVAALAMRFGRRRPLTALGTVLALGWAASVAATLSVTRSDRVYYGTDTRASELLVGALLAVAVAHEPFRKATVNSLIGRWTVVSLGAVALVVSIVLWNRVGVEDGFVSDGGLVVVGLLSAVLILSAAVGVGPVAVLGSLRPLRFLGRISYGVYLFHWPIFVFADEQRTGLDHLPRFGLAVVLTLLLATLSHQWFETPLRRRSVRLGPLTPARLAPVAVLALVAGTLLAPAADPALGGFDADRAGAELDDLASRSVQVAGISTPPKTTVADAPPPVPTPSLAIFGDSVSLSVAYPVAHWALTTGEATFLGGDAELGCGIGRGGKQDAFGIARRTEFCDSWPQRWGAFVDEKAPNLAVVQTAQWELVPRMIPGDNRWRVIGDPVYDDYLHGELLAATDLLARNGGLVVWLTFPYYSSFGDEAQPKAMRDSHSRERVDRLNAMVRQVAAERPDTVRIVDLAAWMADKIDDASLRKDGAHFNSTGAGRVATEFLAPQFLQVWADWYRSTASTSSRTDGGTADG